MYDDFLMLFYRLKFGRLIEDKKLEENRRKLSQNFTFSFLMCQHKFYENMNIENIILHKQSEIRLIIMIDIIIKSSNFIFSYFPDIF